MTEKTKTVCFSGHRVLHDPKETVEKSLENAIRQSISKGADTFIAGGALGVDTIAAHIVIRLREEYPNIRLVLALPCPPEYQTLKWKAWQKKEYNEILKQADEVLILLDRYTGDCMLRRNEYMVDNSRTLIYYLRTDHGGTKHTVDYAKGKDIEMVGL